VTSHGFDAVRSVAVSLERQSLFSAVVGRHTAGVASRSYGMSGGRLSGRGKGGSKTNSSR
jgi:hypothetical protein